MATNNSTVASEKARTTAVGHDAPLGTAATRKTLSSPAKLDVPNSTGGRSLRSLSYAGATSQAEVQPGIFSVTNPFFRKGTLRMRCSTSRAAR